MSKKLRPQIVAFFAIVMGVAASCQNSCNPFSSDVMSPEQIVEAYLNIAFNMTNVSEKKHLLAITTGSLRAALSAASDETIESAYIKRRYNLKSYSVIQRRDRTPRETEITFQLTYTDLGQASDNNDPNLSPKVTTENTVALIKEKGNWLIREVLGNKTTIDFPVSEAAQITARPGDNSTPPEENEEQVEE